MTNKDIFYELPPPPDITPLVGDVFISNERTYIVRTMEYAEQIGGDYARPGFRVPLAVLAKACVLGPATTSKVRFRAAYVHAGNQLPFPIPQIAAAAYFKSFKEGLINGRATIPASSFIPCLPTENPFLKDGVDGLTKHSPEEFKKMYYGEWDAFPPRTTNHDTNAS